MVVQGTVGSSAAKKIFKVYSRQKAQSVSWPSLLSKELAVLDEPQGSTQPAHIACPGYGSKGAALWVSHPWSMQSVPQHVGQPCGRKAFPIGAELLS